MVKIINSKINKAIKKFNMFTRQDRIALAISGGKDSILLSYILKKMGFNIELIFINLGIKSSEESLTVVKNFSEKYNLKLHIINTTEELGFSINDLYKKYKKYTCRHCGSVKRYLLNNFVYKNRFDVLATGHNMDDEIENLLANNLRWDIEHLYKTYPVLEIKEGFIKKVKPLCYLRKKEINKIVDFLKLEYYKGSCDYSLAGSRIKYRSIIEKIDGINPKLVIDYYINFLNTRNIFEYKRKINRCICGNYTTGLKCNICRIKKDLKK
ncbi:MAG TPA: ATP-binding protein [Spirochaetota bacterium]|nr:ATP-binding protein [Spirochaetota bacterium]HOM38316.1 ATP-binding protein [Spirochaetota bacterium]HPQ48466.1 ATP-binding protein [Spirochaetota bacterium]